MLDQFSLQEQQKKLDQIFRNQFDVIRELQIRTLSYLYVLMIMTKDTDTTKFWQ